MTTRLLAVGDMHLGRRPSRLPNELARDGAAFGPAEAWERIVRHAIDLGVDAVALAGDLVDRDDDFFEAYRLLKEGIARLGRHDIRVIGVAGNHDVEVLPRLVEELPDFHLLGAGGEWERLEVAEGLTLHGWSFPTRQVVRSPLAGHAFEQGPGVNLGLLHCDRDVRDSRYAPVSSAELAAAGLDGWLLGHIHVPDALTAQRPSGYLGSITGMHPGEHGVRGPWLIGVSGGRIESVEQQRLAPLHWARMTLDLSGIERAQDLENRLLRELESLDNALDGHPMPPEALGIRLRLTGSTDRANDVAAHLVDLEKRNVSGHGTRFAFIEKFELHTKPERDLQRLAEETNHIGLLARRLLALDGAPGNDTRRALIERAKERLSRTAEESRWRKLRPPALDDETIAGRLRSSASRLLERLIEQQNGEVTQ